VNSLFEKALKEKKLVCLLFDSFKDKKKSQLFVQNTIGNENSLKQIKAHMVFKYIDTATEKGFQFLAHFGLNNDPIIIIFLAFSKEYIYFFVEQADPHTFFKEICEVVNKNIKEYDNIKESKGTRKAPKFPSFEVKPLSSYEEEKK